MIIAVTDKIKWPCHLTQVGNYTIAINFLIRFWMNFLAALSLLSISHSRLTSCCGCCWGRPDAPWDTCWRSALCPRIWNMWSRLVSWTYPGARLPHPLDAFWNESNNLSDSQNNVSPVVWLCVRHEGLPQLIVLLFSQFCWHLVTMTHL